MTSTTLAAPVRTAALGPTGYWLLRVGAALCFIGHGAFGFITKAAWLPYFGVVGIPEGWAWTLMPWVGAVDVMAGMAVLFAPTRIPLIYMAVWAVWTALLRPLSGESGFEFLERAGNYGVPFALLLLTGLPVRLRDLVAPLGAPRTDPAGLDRVELTLRFTTALLLLGHGGLGVLGKPMLTGHYAVLGLPASTTALVGWAEVALAAVVAIRPWPALLVAVALWKLSTEWLFVASGAPIWEFVERAGSYAAPLALAALVLARRQATRGSQPVG
ncbi:MAG: hypothetical protein SFV24_01830 [Gemmatimonadales bacterium]|nr:hypothetical protein [Gemmatimonadales bacterium]